MNAMASKAREPDTKKRERPPAVTETIRAKYQALQVRFPPCLRALHTKNPLTESAFRCSSNLSMGGSRLDPCVQARSQLHAIPWVNMGRPYGERVFLGLSGKHFHTADLYRCGEDKRVWMICKV
jgi:hypothetical protein